MNTSIKHRGPDQKGYTLQRISDKILAMGHVRLSILDLTTMGKQPMVYFKKDGCIPLGEVMETGVQITFNGEIYNHQELRTVLQKLGYHFNSESDTEVVLASYLEWGTECVHKFNGMWAFVIYDPYQKHFFCSRDRLGKKPLYYFFDRNNFIYSSQLKGILQHNNSGIRINNTLDSEALEFYFSGGFIPAPWTIFPSVKKLESGHSLIISIQKDNSLKKKDIQYYHIPPYQPLYKKKQLLKEGEMLLHDSLYIRYVTSDVPVGAFLSGGLDSTSLVGKTLEHNKSLQTFSIGFEKKFDESKYINIAVKKYKTKHHHYYYNKKNFQTALLDIFSYYDEPFSDYSIFPTRYINQKAKQYVTVCISGDGGDEIFGGYPHYQVGFLLQIIRKLPHYFLKGITYCIPSSFKKLQWFFQLTLIPIDQLPWYLPFGSNDKLPTYKRWSQEKFSQLLELNNNNIGQSLMDFDLCYATLGDNYLTKIDRASMSTGIEVRSPFLDWRWISWTKKVPFIYKVGFLGTKKILKEIVHNIVPKAIIQRRKQGFVPPLSQRVQEDANIAIEIKLFLQKYPHFETYCINRENNSDIKIKTYLFIQWYQKWYQK